MYIYVYVEPKCWTAYGLLVQQAVSVERERRCLSTLCHSYRFDYQQRVLHTCLDPGYLHSEYICIYMYIQVARKNKTTLTRTDIFMCFQNLQPTFSCKNVNNTIQWYLKNQRDETSYYHNRHVFTSNNGIQNIW